MKIVGEQTIRPVAAGGWVVSEKKTCGAAVVVVGDDYDVGGGMKNCLAIVVAFICLMSGNVNSCSMLRLDYIN